MDTQVDRARDFMWRSARLIDRLRFAYHFGGGAKEPVVGALGAYQNEDGGFGNALEPDKRDPNSQPVDIQVALEILDEVSALGASPMLVRVCDFLGRISRGGGVPFALPTVEDYPHAPWWTAKPDAPPALNPTAAIVGLLLKARVDHPWVASATAFCWREIEASETTEFHELMPMIAFLTNAPDERRAQRELERIGERVRVPGMVALDPDATGYVHKPLEWAPSPQSFCRKLFADDVIALHLEALAARQRDDGGWPISWTPIAPAVELEWRGVVTINALRTIKAYSRTAGRA